MNISNKEIVKTVEHKMTRKEAYNYFTTKEGLNAFFGLDNKINITPGGAYEIYFLMDNPPGLRGGEGCEILSFIPNKMLSFTWNAPPQYEAIRNSKYHTWVVLEFEDQKITLTHLGWPDDEAWMAVYAYFDNAWDIVLANFTKI